MRNSLRVVLVAGLAAAVVSCVPPMASAPQPEAGGTAALARVVTDAARNQAVFVDSNGTRVDIVSREPDGTTVASTQAVGLAVFSDGSSTSGGVSRNISSAAGERLRAIVVGGRSDGRGGIWTVLTNGTVLPAGEPYGAGNNSNLPDCDDANHGLRGTMGWTYTVTGISNDGLVIIGVAINKNGFQRGGVTIDPGTTVGVFWRATRIDHRPYVSVSTARVIGTIDLSKLPSGHPEWRSHLSSLLISRLSHLKLFFLNYFSAYLTSADSITYDTSRSLYSVTGTDQDGNDAVATIDRRNVITITTVSPPPQTNMALAIQAVTNAFSQSQAQSPSGNSTAFTWTYAPTGGGSVALTLPGIQISGSGDATWGTLTFSSYVDAVSQSTISGTLQVQVFQNGGSFSDLAAVEWSSSGFSALEDVTGTLAFTGAQSGNVTCDFLVTQSGASMSLSGTVSQNGAFFDASTGSATGTPVPTVSFSPASAFQYSPSAASPLTLTSTGAATIYYTLDGTMPTTGSSVYTGPITSGNVDFVVIAFAVNGTSRSRVSLRVYPGGGQV